MNGPNHTRDGSRQSLGMLPVPQNNGPAARPRIRMAAPHNDEAPGVNNAVQVAPESPPPAYTPHDTTVTDNIVNPMPIPAQTNGGAGVPNVYQPVYLPPNEPVPRGPARRRQPFFSLHNKKRVQIMAVSVALVPEDHN
jgi:hypothetical protein